MAGQQQTFIQQATDAVKAGNYQQGLDLARSGLSTAPNDSELKLLEAISLSYLGSNTEASQAFVDAINLNPSSSKARYNAAAHEYRCQNLEQAKILAQHTLQLEPGHEAARQLLNAIDPNATPGPNNWGTPPTAAYPRAGSEYLDVEPAGIPFVKNLGKNWDVIGWMISGVGIALFIYSLVTILPHMNDLFAAGAKGGSGPADMTGFAEKMNQGPFVQVLGWIMIPMNIGYMVLDLIHRRGQMLWLIPHVPCSCCGAGFVTLPLYMLLGRK